jgi:hypothetical protein
MWSISRKSGIHTGTHQSEDASEKYRSANLLVSGIQRVQKQLGSPVAESQGLQGQGWQQHV